MTKNPEILIETDTVIFAMFQLFGSFHIQPYEKV